MKNSYKKYVEQFIKRKMKQNKLKNNKDISVITCTNLPNSLDNILENFIRQDYEKLEN